MQDCAIFSALAMGILQSCTKQSSSVRCSTPYRFVVEKSHGFRLGCLPWNSNWSNWPKTLCLWCSSLVITVTSHDPDVTLASLWFKSPATRLFIQTVMVNIRVTSKLRVTGHLWGEFTGVLGDSPRKGTDIVSTPWRAITWNCPPDVFYNTIKNMYVCMYIYIYVYIYSLLEMKKLKSSKRSCLKYIDDS